MPAAARDLTDVVRDIGRRDLDRPTPCTDYTVRGLLNHLLYWGPSLLTAVRKEDPPPRAASEETAALVTGDWQRRLCDLVADLADALSDKKAWQGTTTMGGGELPGSMIGGMVLVEFVVHGWDLATALGSQRPWSPEAAVGAEDVLRGMAEQGRQMNVFGPAVAVPASAPALDRALALSGRDPAWQPLG
ncbi:TIGR03086 family metal-binding protein [Prauserella oleivorans]|uniref:TIGR03086 family metal-binding protein n=1 Tax=Prauserella oleivorans TaxID=1478153 RepID=A0ABW5W900_9PSEU